MLLQGKTALVTGAGRGIGKGIAIELARRGADLVINDRPDGQDLAGTLEEIRELCVFEFEGSYFHDENLPVAHQTGRILDGVPDPNLRPSG